MATPIPQNCARFVRSAIPRITGGVVVADSAVGDGGEIVGVSTDTRALAPGGAFVALRGETYDGHDHLDAAARAGARLAIVERDVAAPPGLAVVRVQSTLTALGDLAREHARSWRGRGAARTTIAITGSAGKTTTRVALAALLDRLHPGAVHGSAGNLNNRIGVPMVLFGLSSQHSMVVLEMGMNMPGEIAELCRIAEPDVGVVTLVAAAHTELVGSVAGVATEKGALVRALPKGGAAIGNGDDPRVRSELGASPAQRRFLYGRAGDADVRIAARTAIGLDRSRVRFDRRDRGTLEIETPFLGEAGALACAAAIATVELALGEALDATVCAEAFARVDVGAGAGRLVPRVFAGDLAVIDDTYNANPASTCSSIRAAAELSRATGRRLLLVLGEMRELGNETHAGHDEVGRAAAISGAAHVVAIGGDVAQRIALRAGEGGVTAAYVERVDHASALLDTLTRAGDLVLVKGSRSIGTERLVHVLAERGAR